MERAQLYDGLRHIFPRDPSHDWHPPPAGPSHGEEVVPYQQMAVCSFVLLPGRHCVQTEALSPDPPHSSIRATPRVSSYFDLISMVTASLPLSLLVQFARDLQVEFYPYFKEFFPILVSMTDTQDTDVIQVSRTFTVYS